LLIFNIYFFTNRNKEDLSQLITTLETNQLDKIKEESSGNVSENDDSNQAKAEIKVKTEPQNESDLTTLKKEVEEEKEVVKIKSEVSDLENDEETLLKEMKLESQLIDEDSQFKDESGEISNDLLNESKAVNQSKIWDTTQENLKPIKEIKTDITKVNKTSNTVLDNSSSISSLIKQDDFEVNYLTNLNNLKCKDTFFESSQSNNQFLINSCSKLGEDLLKMFLNQINTDIELNVEDKIIKAHKCILMSRSSYFAAMFKGEWSETNSPYISLQGFSYNTVHFSLCHLYSGALCIPKEVNLSELALLSDHLALDTLKDVVIYQLKKNYCHFFHKPCQDCSIGVIDCMILTSQSGFYQLYQKCLSWIGKYFVYIWPTKPFASISNILMDACYQATVKQINPDILIEVMLNAEKLAKSLPKVKWTQRIFPLISQLLEECCIYISNNYDLIVINKSFISLGRNLSWNISTLEESFLAAFTNITPEVACKTLLSLHNLISSAETESAFGYGPYTDNYVIFIKKMYRHCERFLVQNAAHAVHCHSWLLLPPSLQQHIRDSAVIVFEFEKPLAPKPKLSSLSRKVKLVDKNVNVNLNETKNVKIGKSLTKSKSSSKLKSKEAVNKEDNEQVACDYGNHDDLTYSISKEKKDECKSEVKHQVVKVTPFMYTPATSLESDHANSKQPMEKLIDDSINVNNCLKEAKILEQGLSRKLKRQQELCQKNNNIKKRNNSNCSNINNNCSKCLNKIESKGVSTSTQSKAYKEKKFLNRPPFK